MTVVTHNCCAKSVGGEFFVLKRLTANETDRSTIGGFAKTLANIVRMLLKRRAANCVYKFSI